jgi:hypothetical protein
VEAMDDVFRIAVFIIASALVPTLILRRHNHEARRSGAPRE